MTVHDVRFELGQPAYERLGKPPSVDLAFIGRDLLVCAGKRYKLKGLAVLAPQRRMLLQTGVFVDDIELLAGRWTCVVRDVAYHFYMEYTPYAGKRETD